MALESEGLQTALFGPLQYFFIFSSFLVYYIKLKFDMFCHVKSDISQHEATFHNDIGLS